MDNNFKQQLQQREFAVLKDKQRVILKWATGCGKSKMTIDLINDAIGFIPNRPVKVLFLVAERAHIKNWDEEFDKWHLRRDKVATDVICYASLHKYTGFAYDIIVMDEAHHVFSERRMALLQDMLQNNPKLLHQRVYLLSATLSSSKVDMIEELFGKFSISTVTLKEAINNDILPDPKVYVVGMDLNNTQRNQEIKIGSAPNAPIVKWEDRAKYIYKKNASCIIRCTEQQKYLYMSTTMEYWKQRYERTHNEFHRAKWVNLGSTRKRFLGELKTSSVYGLISSFPKNKRYVCFCASVNQAEMLSSHNTISARRSAKSNQATIDAFNARKISNIYAIGMITEGMNLTDIEAGVITQLDGKERLFIQKVGRVLRADSPVIIIFYYKNTQDENYLKGALENIDNKFIKHININQLKTIKL